MSLQSRHSHSGSSACRPSTTIEHSHFRRSRNQPPLAASVVRVKPGGTGSPMEAIWRSRSWLRQFWDLARSLAVAALCLLLWHVRVHHNCGISVDTTRYNDSLPVAPPTLIAAWPQRDWHPCRPRGSSENSEKRWTRAIWARRERTERPNEDAHVITGASVSQRPIGPSMCVLFLLLTSCRPSFFISALPSALPAPKL